MSIGYPMEPNPLTERICSDPELLRYLSAVEIQGLMDVSGHLGDLPERATVRDYSA